VNRPQGTHIRRWEVNTKMDLRDIEPTTVAALSKGRTVLARSKTGVIGSNPIQEMDVCVRLFCVCVGNVLATGCSTVQGVLPIVLGLRN
jgi:hypothetical protein